MSLLVIAVVAIGGGKLGDNMEKEHQVEMDVANLCNLSFRQKMKRMGSGGNSSKQVQTTTCPADAMNGRMQLGFGNDSLVRISKKPEVRGPRACEKRQSLLPDREVQVPGDGGSAECGVRGSNRCADEITSGENVWPEVQVSLACEKSSNRFGAVGTNPMEVELKDFLVLVVWCSTRRRWFGANWMEGSALSWQPRTIQWLDVAGRRARQP